MWKGRLNAPANDIDPDQLVLSMHADLAGTFAVGQYSVCQ